MKCESTKRETEKRQQHQHTSCSCRNQKKEKGKAEEKIKKHRQRRREDQRDFLIIKAETPQNRRQRRAFPIYTLCCREHIPSCRQPQNDNDRHDYDVHFLPLSNFLFHFSDPHVPSSLSDILWSLGKPLLYESTLLSAGNEEACGWWVLSSTLKSIFGSCVAQFMRSGIYSSEIRLSHDEKFNFN